MEALGLDRLKKALLSLNLKCGGTLRQRAERLFAAKTKGTDALPDLKKNEDKEERKKQAVAKLEYRIYKYVLISLNRKFIFNISD